ncbi:MAG TPA: PQQ-dependent sugar dehydrogenase [Trueperaceae bacterium]|nr:PQQ-dependent sugar dehydrogenase [Trueperaceae bacterium]
MLGIIVFRFLVGALLALSISPFSLAQVTATAPALASEPVLEGRYALAPMGLTFDKPVALVAMPDDAGRLLVVELGGHVVATTAGQPEADAFLNLVARVTALQGEQGLFSVAVEPREAAARSGRERFVFAAYTERGTGDLIVGRYPLDETTLTARAADELVILRVAMPEPFHHGGQVAFGPDGMLYVGVGNGESSNHFLHERPWSSPALDTLRGKVLRLDVSGGWNSPAGYVVPHDNPYAAVAGVLPEIYASGFRNPWKFSFDDVTGDLYLADVGNDRYEEVDIVRAGGDYGWPSREGPECQWFPDVEGFVDPECATKTFVEPLISYPHLAIDPEGGQAVTGGVVSRDPDLPELIGAYVYGDFVVGRVWALLPGADQPLPLLLAGAGLTSVAQGPEGELLLAFISGSVARIVPASASDPSSP